MLKIYNTRTSLLQHIILIMVKKNYFLQFFFIFLTLFSLFKLYDNSLNRDAWQYGEWLINYQHGFVRRGLTGEIIFILSRFFNDNIQITFLLLISTICILYYYKSYKLIKSIKLNFIHYIIIFSPLFYLFFVVISKVGVKKEILFKAVKVITGKFVIQYMAEKVARI